METSFDVVNESYESPSTYATDAKQKRRGQKITLNVSNTKYPIVRTVARKMFEWKLCSDDKDEAWDVWWTDEAVQAEKLSKMKPYQKINHFPGMYALSRKNHLARNLNRMQRRFKTDYNFVPKTWLLPADHPDLRARMQKGQIRTVIVKPEAACQGRGIFLARKIDDIDPEEAHVCQEYMQKPYLIDGLKFDLRIYVLVTGWNPLRIFVHEEGLTRFATVPYQRPTAKNSDDMCMHLTNYAINKSSPYYQSNHGYENGDIGHKRTLKSTYDHLQSEGHNVQHIKNEIKDMIIKTLASVQPSLAHTYISWQPKNPENNMWFEILGLDIILNSKLKPKLLEVNHSPSFSTNSPLDYQIKKKVIYDSLVLMNIDSKQKRAFKKQEMKLITKRSRGYKTQRCQSTNLQEQINVAKQNRDAYEEANLGGFEKIYPQEGYQEYDKYIAEADRIWQQWTGGNRKLVPKSTELQKTKSLPRARVVRKLTPLKSIAKLPLYGPSLPQPKVFERLYSKRTSKVGSPPSSAQHNGNTFDYRPQVFYDMSIIQAQKQNQEEQARIQDASRFSLQTQQSRPGGLAKIKDPFRASDFGTYLPTKVMEFIPRSVTFMSIRRAREI